MPYIEWDEGRYGVGVEHIDEQHRQLFATINDLHAAMTEGRGREELEAILDDLESYTNYHFGDEEAFMQNCGYSEACAGCFRSHTDVHREFEERVADIRSRYEAGEMTVTMDTLEFLRTWLTSHIAGSEMDQDYAGFTAEESA